MLAYLPALRPDELLYSLLARLCRHGGILSPKQMLEEAFGRRTVYAHPFLQTNLHRLATNLPPKRGLTEDRLAMDTTLFPYLTAFQPASVRAWAMTTMSRGAAESLHVRLGLAAGTVRLPVALRYCPACRAEMLAQHGELYWRREFQLPGVLVCLQHSVPVTDSLVRPAEQGQHNFVAADENNCPAAPSPPAWAAKPEAMKLLWNISRASTALLSTPPDAQPLTYWGGHYRDALAARGLGKGTSRIDQNALQRAYLAHFDPVLSILPNAAPDAWLEDMGRKHRKAIAPLHHLLLRLLLEALPLSNPRPQPFGLGPWPCRNPLAEHYRQSVIADCTTHREGGKTIGAFRCACGYAFSMATEPASRLRILDFGPLFEARLRVLVANETSLRGTAKALHVDAKTVLRYVGKFAIATSWKPVAERLRQPPVDRETVPPRRREWNFGGS
ncbi:TnsD family Tn7-like transposition protein [Acidiphilium multivorum]|uniref:TnsD family Tn7-like transposition protein n=1 Tax=Acidiphilium multivorum TaxID=62140 RepID=UPI0039C8DC69